MTAGTDSMKTQLCQILYKIGALKFGTFKLSNGKLSPYYIDLRLVPSFPEAFHRTCEFYVNLIEDKIKVERFQRIAGIPTAGISFASVIAYHLNKSLVYPRSTQRKHGRERRVEGILMPGDRVLLLDDLVTSGNSLLKAASAIRAEGGIVSDAIVLIDREEGGKERLAKDDIELYRLLTAKEAASRLHSIRAITTMEFQTILKQRKD
ncbi:MAG: orotate phosphoribosyltransferase [Candidatus Bathyarchaeota archaeon]|nr:MAG: orotate phosphoribosyltransferase [Candidatus Bathyarchaeota archaeon]